MAFKTGVWTLIDMPHVNTGAHVLNKLKVWSRSSQLFQFVVVFNKSFSIIVIMEASFIAKYIAKLAENCHLSSNNACIIWHGTLKSGKQPIYGVLYIKVDKV